MRRVFHWIVAIFSFIAVVCAQQGRTDTWRQEHKQKLYANWQQFHKTAAIQQQGLFDAKYYKLNLTLQYDTKEITGRMEGHFKVLSDSLRTIVLNFQEKMQVTGSAEDVASVTHQGNFLLVDLKRSFHRDELVNIVLSYQGSPDSKEDISFNFDVMSDGSEYVWTLSEPYGARNWWPCKDTPADKADSLDMFITVPETQVVGSNGILVQVNSGLDGWKTFHWHEKYPIATYLVSIVAGEYAHFQDYYFHGQQDSMLLDYYVFPDKLEEAKTGFSEMSDYLDALSYYFGPYQFLDEKYGQAQFGWGGGMEHQTLTSVGRVNINSRYLFVHELGHQWFGDAVTCASWHDIWLNEGFASYSEALYAEWAGFNEYGPGFDAYQEYMFTQYFTDGGTIFIEDTTDFANIFGRIVYDKGSWVLHMLRHVIGDEVFFDVLKKYVNDVRWKYGSVRTSDFQAVCEEESGQDLDAFFDQWLMYPGFPKYVYSWEQDGTRSLSLSIRQEQYAPIYQMPMDVRVTFSDSTQEIFKIENYLSAQQYNWNLTREVVDVELDPSYWILRELRRDGSLKPSRVTSILAVYPTPFWESVRIVVYSQVGQPGPLDIFDSRGRKIVSLEADPSGYPYYRYIWNGRNTNGKMTASGIYFARLQSSNSKYPLVKKIIFLP